MKDLFTCFSNFWSNILGAPHSAPFGTCWQPSGKLHSLSMCAAMFVLLFVAGVGNAWAVDPVATLSFTGKCGGTGTDSEGNSWTISSDATESTYSSTQGIHYGTNDVSVDHVNISTTAITSTVSQVVVEASRGSNSVSLSVSVGGTDFKCGGNTSVAITTTNTSYTFTGSASGTILVHLYKPGGSATKKAIYCKSVSVTHASAT